MPTSTYFPQDKLKDITDKVHETKCGFLYNKVFYPKWK